VIKVVKAIKDEERNNDVNRKMEFTNDDQSESENKIEEENGLQRFRGGVDEGECEQKS
jgi:hypothetical protein